jgi:hypothetical protein
MLCDWSRNSGPGGFISQIGSYLLVPEKVWTWCYGSYGKDVSLPAKCGDGVFRQTEFVCELYYRKSGNSVHLIQKICVIGDWSRNSGRAFPENLDTDVNAHETK